MDGGNDCYGFLRRWFSWIAHKAALHRCHGREGFSSSVSVPNLAAMDRLVIWKQLADFRSGKRSSLFMQPIANSLSLQDSADVRLDSWWERDRLRPRTLPIS
jgi:cytochrome c553